MQYIIKCRDGRRWGVRKAVSLDAACNAIAHCRVSGSVGATDTLNETYVGGGITTLADVVQLNADGTERQPYTEGY